MKKNITVADAISTFLEVLGEQIEIEQPSAVDRDLLVHDACQAIEEAGHEKFTILEEVIIGHWICGVFLEHGYRREGSRFVKGAK